MDTVDPHNLLVSKENIQPLRQGRDTSKLSTALQAETDSELQHTLEKQRNEFEIRLRSKGSDDPLSDWCDYIHWIEQSFPKRPREGKLNVVLQKCLNKFKDSERYKNDVRFVRLCIKYAEIEENTVELLGQIHCHGIGVTCAELYIAWAEKYAMNNCFKKANVIYEKGIENKAEPLELLKEAHQKFHTFLVRRMLNVKEEFKPTFLEPLAPETRQPYNVLRPVSCGEADIVSNIRVGQNVKGSPGKLKMGTTADKKPKSNACIKIFQDTENEPVTTEQATKLEKIPNRKKATKENTIKPGPWTDKQKKNVPFTIASSSVPFQVHRDEEDYEASNRLQTVPSSVLKSHSKKEYDDASLANIPLFYPEAEDKSKIVMYCKDQVYAGGLEFQFEELRAIEYNKRVKVKKCIVNTVLEPNSEIWRNNEVLDFDEKPNIELGHKPHYEADFQSENLNSDTQNVMTRKEESTCSKVEKNKAQPMRTLFPASEPTDQMLKNKCSTEEVLPTTEYSMNQTIHTKEALSEMQQLWFSKPASPLLHDNGVSKQAGKSILKTSKPCFNLYIDESCLDSFKNVQTREGPLDLTIKSSSNSELQIPDVQNDQNALKQEMVYDGVINSYTATTERELKLIDKIQEPDNENKENDVPEDYCGPVGKPTRKVTGILTPAENIAVVPLSDLEDDEENEDQDDIEYCPAAQCNTTGVTENLTKAFQFPRNESTPNPRKSFHNKPDLNRSLFDSEGYENNNDDKYQNDMAKEFSKPQGKSEAVIDNALHVKRSPSSKEEKCAKTLSVIVETSREYKSSSSGGSGITFQIRSKNYPLTPIDARGTSSTSVSHSGLHKTKGLSLTGYEASTESSHTGLRSRISTSEKLGIPQDSCELKILPSKLLDCNTGTVATEDIINAGEISPQDKHQEYISSDEINPFSDKAINDFLKFAGFPSSKYAKIMIYEDSLLSTPKVGSSITLGKFSYDVRKIVGEGAYAKVYDLTNKSTGNRIIAKIQKPAFEWEFYIVQELHLRLGDKTLASSFMKIESAYFFRNASVLLTKPVEYGNLLDTVNTLKQNQQICHLAAVYFTVEMLRILDVLHRLKIIHADVKPDNFLVMCRNEKPKLQLIDFGRSIDMTLLPKGTTFKQVITTDGFTTTEMRMGKPWTYQVDLYGVANCSHCLLFGEYMQVIQKYGVWSITKIIPRYWARTEWKNYFSTLLNIESCDAIPNISTLMEPFEVILTDNKELDFVLNRLNNILSSR